MKKLNNLYEQITPKTSPEQLAQQVINTPQIKMTAKKRTSKVGGVLLAAAISVSALTITVGAANGWDYAGIFENIFGEKSANITENILPVASITKNCSENIDVELSAAAADKHGVLAILDITAKNGYKLMDGEELTLLNDLFISINSDTLSSSATSINIIEQSEDKVRLAVKMTTDDQVKNQKITVTISEVCENGDTKAEITNSDDSSESVSYSPTWQAEFDAEYKNDEIIYETDKVITGVNYEGSTKSVQLEKFEVSPITMYIETAESDDFFDLFWDATETYAVTDSGDKIRITGISVSGYTENDTQFKQRIAISYEEPVNPSEICALEIMGETITIK